MESDNSRRNFLKKSALASAGFVLAPTLLKAIEPIAGGASSENNSLFGSQETSILRNGNAGDPLKKVTLAVIGVNSRGNYLAEGYAMIPGVEVKYICDVDDKAIKKGLAAVKKVTGKDPIAVKDFRTILNDKELDGVIIATPDHWHAPAAILACIAGKHVYVEKPCCHNPWEGEMLVKAARKYNVHVQQGSQRRSHPLYIQAIEELHAGIIGNAYFARGWYTNNRKAIGIGKVVPVPATFDYELWQGPAKRQPFKDNLHPYNWHWRWTYGTAETGNNATHELDVMRWGLDVVHPTRVTSSGGRYAFPKDDWEMPDTQTVLYEFDDNKSMSWEGRCCNSFDDQGDTRGVIFYGSKGTMKIIGSKYQVYDSNNKLVKEIKGAEIKEAMNNTVGQGYSFDGYHFNNFIAAIRDNTKLNSEIEIGFASTLLPLLGNIAQRTGRVIHIDKTNGHILNDKEAMKLWKRDYQPGWEPKI